MTKSKINEYNILRLLSFLIAVAGVLTGVVKNDPIIAFIGIGLGMVLLLSVQRRYKVVSTDERIQHIRQKAGSATFGVFAVGFSLLFLINYYVYPFTNPLTSEDVGSMFGYISILMIYCNLGFYAYYKSKI